MGNPGDSAVSNAPSPFPPPPGDDDLAAQSDPDRWHDFTIGGITLRGRVPPPQALHVLRTATSGHVRAEVQTDMTWLFLRDHLDEPSVDRIMAAMIDPDTTWDMTRLGEVIRAIATLGTARPFVPWPH